MDTLWASLLGLFAIALAVVLAFNLLQGRQTRLRDAWRAKLGGGGSAPGSRPEAAARATPGDRDASGSSSGDAVPAGRRSITHGDTERSARVGRPERIEPTLGPGPDGGDVQRQGGQHDSGAIEAPRSVAPRSGQPAHAARGPQDAQAARDAGAHAADEPDWTVEPGGAQPESPEPGVPTDPRPSAKATPAGPLLDPRLECIVGFSPSLPIAPERLLAAASTLRRVGSKPIAIEADAGDGRWSVPSASFGAVRRARAGVLLANRHGPLNAMEFSEFTGAMQTLGRALGAGGAIVPDMAPVLEHARQLDEACAQLDAVIGLNVETPTALSPAELSALATGLALHQRGNNRYAALGDDGEVLFSLALGERAEQLVLLLDVPRAPESAQPWARMVEAARLCAERTGGRVVDDAARPLTDAAAAAVARQLGQRYAALAEAGLDAGSSPALRVFN